MPYLKRHVFLTYHKKLSKNINDNKSHACSDFIAKQLVAPVSLTN